MLWGCTTDAKVKIDLDGETMVRCPRRPFIDENSEEMDQLLWFYSNYKKGFLPVEGGLLDQPGRIMDLFRIVDGAINSVEHAEAEKRKQEEAKARNRAVRR